MLWAGSTPQIERVLEENEVTRADFEEAIGYAPQPHRTYQLFTHALLHADPLHLASNLLFLFVFGTRVNALIGNVLTAILYPLLAVLAAVSQLAATKSEDVVIPNLGASGAVMGLAGMYFVLMPTAKVHMIAWWRWGLLRWFELNLKQWAVRGFWVVLFYLSFEVIYTAVGMEDDVAHWAHLGGFLFGAVIALILLLSRLVNARGGDLLSAMLGKAAWKLLGKPNRPALSLW
jgi:membrane associated rhomboid family serine protease